MASAMREEIVAAGGGQVTLPDAAFRQRAGRPSTGSARIVRPCGLRASAPRRSVSTMTAPPPDGSSRQTSASRPRGEQTLGPAAQERGRPGAEERRQRFRPGQPAGGAGSIQGIDAWRMSGRAHQQPHGAVRHQPPQGGDHRPATWDRWPSAPPRSGRDAAPLPRGAVRPLPGLHASRRVWRPRPPHPHPHPRR